MKISSSFIKDSFSTLGLPYSELDFCHSSDTGSVTRAVLHVRLREEALKDEEDEVDEALEDDDGLTRVVNAVVEMEGQGEYLKSNDV